ncbi:LacI family DNA-binding transcriptional regulator [Pseudomonas gingeri]|uniref:LacI family DNA-binding transcriptional regulator n=1 Tax=Pseudomonas gingeri TaxID=117681 RepID=UPI0015A071E2|nr:LacI family DNA-binding transcriptional regulator [Pseudomonas gingeri]NWA28547.1 LacI family DNA-binding transcriptional regulator [Pseudomonas gingeri]NWD71183.1 LacI family DNA-binding transcriptional regulator [Pseudomonas gingeri]
MTIHEIARLTGVSIATVSRVINGTGRVGAVTREKVQACIAEQGFTLNRHASSLRSARSNLLLALVPDLGNPFYAEVIRGINNVARRQGYSLLVCDTGAEAEAGRTFYEMLKNHQADGVICLDPETTQHALAQDAALMPWVACCEFDRDAAVPYVGIDNAEAARAAVSYLIGRGYQRVALINGDPRFLYARERERGFREALEQASLQPMLDGIVVAGDVGMEDGRLAASQLLALKVRPDAILAASDMLAIGAMLAIREARLSIPQDVAVMGFDNIPFSAATQPALSTVAQPSLRLGESAAKLLLNKINNPNQPSSGVLLEHELVVRGST